MTPEERANEAISRLTALVRDYGHNFQRVFAEDVSAVLDEVKRLRAEVAEQREACLNDIQQEYDETRDEGVEDALRRVADRIRKRSEG